MARATRSPSVDASSVDASSVDTSSRTVAAAPPAAADRALAVEAVRALARAARLLERGAGELGLPMYRVLSSIDAGEDRASRVAERFGLGRPAVSAAVEALCRDGLVRRTGVPGDQRALELSVTPLGRAALDQVEEELVAVLVDLCGRTADPSTGRGLEALAALGPAVDDLLATRRRRRQEEERRDRRPERR